MTSQAAIETASHRRTSFVDPKALMKIRNLELRARVVVEGFWAGIHRSPFHGFSVEFTEYRQYTPGDDPRYLDWRVVARSDRYFIKRFEDETNLRCTILLDRSRSLSFGSTGYTKGDYGATMSATLAQFLHSQGDAVGLLTFDESIREYLPPRHRTGHLRNLMLALEQPVSGKSTNLEAPLQQIAQEVRKRGLVILISDFLTPLTNLEAPLTMLSASGHDVVLFQVLDPAEVTFNFRLPSMFRDLESGGTLFIDPDTARPEYLRNFEVHCAELRGMVQRLGMSYNRSQTDRPLELALFDFLRGRLQLGRRIRRVNPFGKRRQL